jgi:hypothetical protein
MQRNLILDGQRLREAQVLWLSEQRAQMSASGLRGVAEGRSKRKGQKVRNSEEK